MMKNLSLLLVASIIAMGAAAQERLPMTLDRAQKMNFEKVPYAVGNASLTDARYFASKKVGAAKTTTSMGRWYNYAAYLKLRSDYDRLVTGAGIHFVDFYGPVMWNDTVNMLSYINGTTYTSEYSSLVSLGTVLRPQFNGFNRTNLFGTGLMRVTDTDSYIVDSISISYYYAQGSKATAGHIDTVRLSFLIGDGTPGSSISGGIIAPVGPYIVGTEFYQVAYDDILNIAVGAPAPAIPAIYQDIIFAHNTDTSVFGKTKRIKLTTPLVVPAGNFVSCIMSYKSGEPAGVLKTLPGDTLSGVGGRYYDLFQPFVDYVTTDDPAIVANTKPDWIVYDSTDLNVAEYVDLPNVYSSGGTDCYLPNWAWHSSATPSGAAYYGYADIGYHIVCSTCTAVPAEVKTTSSVNNINAVPNPANNEVNINFSLVSATNVTVSLTNVVGEVVATQSINNTANGKATFNTVALPAGVYVYTLIANGEKNIGRVVITH